MAVTPDTIPPIGDAPDWPVLAGVTDKNAYLAQVEVADTRQQPYTDEQNTAIDAINTVAGQTQANAEIAETKAGEAESSASSALDSRNEAEVFKDSAEAAAIAASEGAGLPSGGDDGDVLTLIDSVAGTVGFQSKPPSGLVPLLTAIADNDLSIEFTDLDSYGYKSYKIFCSGAPDTQDINLRFSSNNGVSFISSNDYSFSKRLVVAVSPTTNPPISSSASWHLGYIQISTGQLSQAEIIISNIDSYASVTSRFMSASKDSDSMISGDIFGALYLDQAVNAVQLYATLPITGSFTLYGVSEL